MKTWIAKKKLALTLKWAQQFGLFVCRIDRVGGTEYLVDRDGVYRRLVTKKN